VLLFAALHMSLIGTSRHFGAMRNLVAIGAKRTSTKPRQSSSVYEYAPQQQQEVHARHKMGESKDRIAHAYGVDVDAIGRLVR
jgi:hypothetical protein